jgi:hypothetical protein
VDIREAVKSSISASEVIRKLRRAHVGSNYKWLKKQVLTLKLDISHWKGVAHGTSPQPSKLSTEILTEDSGHHTCTVKSLVLRENLLPYMCQQLCFCGQGTRSFRQRHTKAFKEEVMGYVTRPRNFNLKEELIRLKWNSWIVWTMVKVQAVLLLLVTIGFCCYCYL